MFYLVLGKTKSQSGRSLVSLQSYWIGRPITGKGMLLVLLDNLEIRLSDQEAIYVRGNNKKYSFIKVMRFGNFRYIHIFILELRERNTHIKHEITVVSEMSAVFKLQKYWPTKTWLIKTKLKYILTS